MRLPIDWTLPLLLCFFAGSLSAYGDDAVESERRDFMLQKLKDLDVSVPGLIGSESTTFDEEPLLRFSNPISGVVDAGVFVWKREGYPQAIGKIFVNEKKEAWGAYISSLATTRLQMKRDGRRIWTPGPQKGFKRIADAARPSTRSAFRNTQMRNIAQQFQVLDLWKEDPTVNDQDVSDWTLRLLARPLLRYDSKERNVLDGAVFAFVLGTNPEVLLSVEAIDDQSEPYWQYRFTRLTIYELKALRKKKQVWSAERRLAHEMESNMPSHHTWEFFERYPFQRSDQSDGENELRLSGKS